jgi:hypothetical protein
MSPEAASNCGKGPQAKNSAPITEMPFETYSFSITKRFLFRGSLAELRSLNPPLTVELKQLIRIHRQAPVPAARFGVGAIASGVR